MFLVLKMEGSKAGVAGDCIIMINKAIILLAPCRVVVPEVRKTIGEHDFANWGAHCDGYPCAYLTAAAGIGMRREEVDVFCKRLNKTFTKFKQKHRPSPLCPPSTDDQDIDENT